MGISSLIKVSFFYIPSYIYIYICIYLYFVSGYFDKRKGGEFGDAFEAGASDINEGRGHGEAQEEADERGCMVFNC